MHLHFLQHVSFEGLGSIRRWAEQGGWRVSSTGYHRGEAAPQPDAIDLLVIMGGPMGVHDEGDYPWLKAEKAFIRRAMDAGLPVLGICLGAQLLADVLGARVYRNREKEIGWFPVRRVADGKSCPVAACLPAEFPAFHWHGDTFDLPAGAVHLARSEACPNQAFVYADRVVALQFHLETTPETAEALIRNCGHEIVPGPHIQAANDMLADPKRFGRINSTMVGLLDWLAGRAGGAGSDRAAPGATRPAGRLPSGSTAGGR